MEKEAMMDILKKAIPSSKNFSYGEHVAAMDVFATVGGVFLLRESLTPRLVLSLVLVSLVIYVVNKK